MPKTTTFALALGFGLCLGLGVQVACTSTQERGAITVAECLDDLLHDVLVEDSPGQAAHLVPVRLSEMTEQDVSLITDVIDTVKTCRARVKALKAKPAPVADAGR